MKKEIQCIKTSRNMATKTVPKNLQTIVSSLIDFVVNIADDNEDLREAMLSHQDELIKLLKTHTESQKSTGGKKKKDPNAPKRGKSGYIHFCVDKRSKIKDNNPDMSAKDIIKELGRVWREDVTVKEKDKYNKLSNIDKQRYEKEMKDYTPPIDTGTITTEKVKREGPKRGLTAYIFFCKNQRPIIKDNNPNLSTKEITIQLGKEWKELSENEKSPYNKLAQDDKKRYENEKNHQSKSKSSTKQSKSKSSTKQSKSKSSTKQSKSKSSTKKGKSAYIIFCQQERQKLKNENDELTGQEITKELARQWKELSPKQQSKFNRSSTVESEFESDSELDDLLDDNSD